MAISPVVRMFTADLTVFSLRQTNVATTLTDILGFYQDATINLEFEHDEAPSPGDTLNSTIQGFVMNKFKARSWSADFSTHYAVGGTLPTNRQFGWEIVSGDFGGMDVAGLFTDLEFSMTAETMDARVPTDTNPFGADPEDIYPGFSGWRYPRIKTRSWEVSFRGRVTRHPAGSEGAVQNPAELLWGSAVDGVSFTLTGPAFEISGTGALGGGSVSFPDEAVEQEVRIICQGAPPTIDTTGTPPRFLNMMTLIPNVAGKGIAGNPSSLAQTDLLTGLSGAALERSRGFVGVRLSRPGGPSATAFLSGDGFLTDARFAITDGAIEESGTITGYGPFIPTT